MAAPRSSLMQTGIRDLLDTLGTEPGPLALNEKGRPTRTLVDERGVGGADVETRREEIDHLGGGSIVQRLQPHHQRRGCLGGKRYLDSGAHEHAARADVSGNIGKQLGDRLGVDVVRVIDEDQPRTLVESAGNRGILVSVAAWASTDAVAE